MTAFTAALNDTVGVTDTLARKAVLYRPLADTVGVAEFFLPPKVDVVGIAGTISVSGVLVQYDTWRPISRPSNNSLVLVCRTPVGDHDITLTDLSLWTMMPEGGSERPVVLSVADNGYGWAGFAHPEWSPDGTDVVVAVETSTHFKITLLDATGFGT